jgi:hypothetical protein
MKFKQLWMNSRTKGIIERTGEMRWAERSREWQPVYALTELGRALSAADISLDDYQDRAS